MKTGAVGLLLLGTFAGACGLGGRLGAVAGSVLGSPALCAVLFLGLDARCVGGGGGGRVVVKGGRLCHCGGHGRVVELGLGEHFEVDMET